MANLRRRSARLSKTDSNQSSARKTPLHNARLGSLVERDETPDAAQRSIDNILATPTSSRVVQEQLSRLGGLKTPQTKPKLEQAEMDPKTVHRSTAKAPDSGLKLGFSDIRMDRTHDTPTKSTPKERAPTSSTFEFQFSSDAQLSSDAQRLMDNVREDAARIKAQMIAEKAAQEQKDRQAETMFGAGRKIAQPKGKAGRFSDVHMAQFKKMDSIENHASAFRARPGFAAPTAQSLKRSPSKAGLDELARPRIPVKAAVPQPQKISPPIIGRPYSVSPFKSIPTAETRSTPGSSKRVRQSGHEDVSDSRLVSTLPRPKSSLYSPTKSSLARTSEGSTSPAKPSMIPRSNSVKSTKNVSAPVGKTVTRTNYSPSKPLPPLPAEEPQVVYPTLPSSPDKALSVTARETKFTSKLPTLSGLRSILRGKDKTSAVAERPGTPKRPNTATGPSSDSPKKVDFTPSVKSRHAVKLAAYSPSPAKIRRDTPAKSTEPVIPYDSSAWIIEDDNSAEWEDEDSEVNYPTLVPLESGSDPSAGTLSTRAKEHNLRESKEFKSIFTTLHPAKKNEPATLTSINTTVNKTNPETHANRVLRSPSNSLGRPSPSTIRQVRHSTQDVIQPYEDKIKLTTASTLPAKKRRQETVAKNNVYESGEDAKENQQAPAMPNVPGGWDDAENDEIDNEGTSRGGKRARMVTAAESPAPTKAPVKKASAAREIAAKSAKERKGKGVLSLSRLNMLSRPKTRG